MRIYSNCLSNNKEVNNICKHAKYQRDVEVSHSEIIHAIKDLKDNKCCGLDGISAEHLKYCSDVIIPLLSMCFTSLFVHRILPELIVYVVLVPIVKNTNASICSKINYRPIALASSVSKVFEKHMYDRIAYSLIICDNQFGFKAKYSTDVYICLQRGYPKIQEFE